MQIDAIGLAAGRVHAQHIHGLPGGDSITPPRPIADADNDGLIELAEGGDFYGPILLPLDDASGGFPTAPGGVVDFDFTYSLSDSSIFQAGADRDDLFPLTDREIVIHGGFPQPAAGLNPADVLTPNDLDATGYSVFLPILAGEIEAFDFTQLPNNGDPGFATAVPLPAAGWALLAALGALFGYGRRRARA